MTMKAAPAPIVLLIASFLCPTELSLYLGDLRLPPHRVAILLLFPIALFRLMTRPDIRLKPFDALFATFAMWTMWVYGQHDDGNGYVYGGSLAVESLGGYLVARAWIRDSAAMTATLRVMMVAIVVSALIALPETLFGQTFTHDLLFQITGYKHPTAVETRSFNLARAYGTFDHPIHYGTFCAALFALFWFAERRSTPRIRRATVIGFATTLGISAAPLLCIALQSSMLAWERLTRGIAQRTPLTLTVLAGLYIGASMVSNRSPITLIATGMTFDAWTGFYRLQIWEHGLNNVWESPWLGIGLAEWDRPLWMVSSTIDAFWLVTALRAGIPGFLLLALAIIVLGRSVVVRGIKSRDQDIKKLATGWMMSLIALCLIACTVHYWNVLNAFFFFFLGLAGWLADPKKSKRTAAVATRPTEPVIPIYPSVNDGAFGPYAHGAARYGIMLPSGTGAG